jgi:chitinase
VVLLTALPLSRQLVDRQTLQGEVVQPDHKLLGYWDSDIQRGDYFTYEGNRYDIAFVTEKRDYEVTAEVVFRGQQG